ncbi:hypothetical protein ANN_09429 [Periplaneta americana]|uniref:Uncharacterized protein n=1 Tax=Periplaneta americana TaxID=6978 RepID=A0ABQ8TNU8_PERAM|nr:hypothetical protein ANN_09429 [Periplaneta americana]
MDCSTESLMCSLVRRNKVCEARSTSISSGIQPSKTYPIPDSKKIMVWDAKLKQTGSLLPSSGKHAKKEFLKRTLNSYKPP